MQAITTIGLDIAKSVFQVHGVDCRMRQTRTYRVCRESLPGLKCQVRSTRFIDTNSNYVSETSVYALEGP